MSPREEAAMVLLLRAWRNLGLQLRDANALTPGSLRALEDLDGKTEIYLKLIPAEPTPIGKASR